MTRPDAYAVAAAMNARPLPADTDGGLWEAGHAYLHTLCDGCGAMMRDALPLVSSDTHVLCLPCAIADVQRAHAAADPHSHTDREVKS